MQAQSIHFWQHIVFHPGNVEIYQGLNHSPELDRVLYPQVCMRCLRIAEMLVVVWLSKFSTIIANPASSTDGSFGFKQFHPSKPTVVQGVRHGKGMVQCVARSESSEKIFSVPWSSPKCIRPVVILGVEILSTSGKFLSEMCSCSTGMKSVVQSINLSAKWTKLDVWIVQVLLPFRKLRTCHQ